jgi:putative ABC transport system ATP-binding protein
MSLILEDIRLTYADGAATLVALDDISLHVPAGEFAAVVGPSGSGKSSLLAVAGLLLTPDTGRVAVAGIETSGLSRGRLTALRQEHIGFVFQQSNLLASLTAIDQLLAVAHFSGQPPAAARERATELLDAVGLAAARHRRPHQLSGGERQRVGIARSLMGNPTVLLVDEPTSALDRERGAAVVGLLARLTRERGVATVMVTHDTAHLAAVDRVLTMEDGRVRELAGAHSRATPKLRCVENERKARATR